jgi:hypothetical protein
VEYTIAKEAFGKYVKPTLAYRFQPMFFQIAFNFVYRRMEVLQNGVTDIVRECSCGSKATYCNGFAKNIKLWSQETPLLGKQIPRNTLPTIQERCSLWSVLYSLPRSAY